MNKLLEIKNANKTVILYEAPHKLNATLKDLKEILGNRQVVLAREITKIHEEYIRGTISELLDKTEGVKGEIVLIIEKNKVVLEDNLFKELSLDEHYKMYEKQGFEKKEIIKKIAKDRNVNKNQIYQYFISK